MRTFAAALICLLVSDVLSQQDGSNGGRRRRIKKKIVKQQRVVPEVEEEPDVQVETEAGEEVEGFMEEVAKQLFKAVEEEDIRDIVAEGREKQPRGFLDDYYSSQFEARTEKAQVDMLAAESVHGTPRLSPQFYSPAGTATETGERRRGGEEEQLGQLIAKEEQLQELLAREAELSPAQREELLRQLSQWPAKQGQSLYTNGLSDLTGPMENDLPSKRHTEEKPFGPSLPFSTYMSGLLPSTDDSSLERDLSTFTPQSSYGAPDDTYKTNDVVSATKYVGLTGTTSQDIQLGLTFTVPFLSIPLTGIESILSGAGIGDVLSSGLGLFDINNIDIGSIATIAVITIAAIFVLPQAIYWLTGINLSTFNWGRSDDPSMSGAASGLVALANTVDNALTEFNIDGKGCIAKSMCTTLYDKNKKSENVMVKALMGSAVKNPNMIAFLGSDTISRLSDYESVVEKYGNKAQKCEAAFRAICPWDTAGMTSIAMKLMSSQGTNLADLAMKAAAAAGTSKK